MFNPRLRRTRAESRQPGLRPCRGCGRAAPLVACGQGLTTPLNLSPDRVKPCSTDSTVIGSPATVRNSYFWTKDVIGVLGLAFHYRFYKCSPLFDGECGYPGWLPAVLHEYRKARELLAIPHNRLGAFPLQGQSGQVVINQSLQSAWSPQVPFSLDQFCVSSYTSSAENWLTAVDNASTASSRECKSLLDIFFLPVE